MVAQSADDAGRPVSNGAVAALVDSSADATEPQSLVMPSTIPETQAVLGLLLQDGHAQPPDRSATDQHLPGDAPQATVSAERGGQSPSQASGHKGATACASPGHSDQPGSHHEHPSNVNEPAPAAGAHTAAGDQRARDEEVQGNETDLFARDDEAESDGGSSTAAESDDESDEIGEDGADAGADLEDDLDGQALEDEVEVMEEDDEEDEEAMYARQITYLGQRKAKSALQLAHC